jgi:hypothetical protein
MFESNALILGAISSEETAPLDNALDPNRMTAAERLTEIGEILAAGILRLRAKAHAAGDRRDLSLAFPANQSLHAKHRKRRENAWRITC